jgi:dihydrofolate reductase
MQLVVTQNITLDGVIEMIGDWFDPTSGEEADNSDLVEVIRRHMQTEDALLLGRNTFESFRGYWPQQTGDTTGITDKLNKVQKYVVSSTMQDPEWENTTVLRGSLEEEVRALKAKPGREIGITGSISIVREVISAGLVDEYRLFVFPVVLGRGERLFADAMEVPKLRLVEATPFRSGVVLLSYRPA